MRKNNSAASLHAMQARRNWGRNCGISSARKQRIQPFPLRVWNTRWMEICQSSSYSKSVFRYSCSHDVVVDPVPGFGFYYWAILPYFFHFGNMFKLEIRSVERGICSVASPRRPNCSYNIYIEGLYCVFFTVHAWNGYISTSGLKSDITVMFLDPDLL